MQRYLFSNVVIVSPTINVLFITSNVFSTSSGCINSVNDFDFNSSSLYPNTFTKDGFTKINERVCKSIMHTKSFVNVTRFLYVSSFSLYTIISYSMSANIIILLLSVSVYSLVMLAKPMTATVLLLSITGINNS